MANVDISSLEKDPRLFLYTSLTAGSSHIITATSRLETILKANKIPFLAIDTATDERARRLWQRRAQGKKLPGLVKEGYVLGDLEEVEEWNEFGELHENIGPTVKLEGYVPKEGQQEGVRTAPTIGVQVPFTKGSEGSEIAPKGVGVKGEEAVRIALPGAAEIAAMAKKKAETREKERGASRKEVEVADVVKEKGLKDGSGLGGGNDGGVVTMEDGEVMEVVGSVKVGDGVGLGEEKKGKNDGVKDAAGKEETVVPASAEKKQEENVAPATGVKKEETVTTPSLTDKKGDDDDDDDDATEVKEATKAVEDLRVSNRTQDQSANAPEEAAKSVRD